MYLNTVGVEVYISSPSNWRHFLREVERGFQLAIYRATESWFRRPLIFTQTESHPLQYIPFRGYIPCYRVYNKVTGETVRIVNWNR